MQNINNDDGTGVLVTGGTGMLGMAIRKFMPNAIYVGSNEYDLTSPEQAQKIFKCHEPQYVIHLAARVGGVKGNTDYVADFCRENLLINTNVLHCSHKFKIKKLISVLSTCIYPDKDYVKYPLTEEQLHQGPPHPSNFGYAYAKRMLEVQSRAYNQQYGCNFICAIPNNLFGLHDNFDLQNGHVIPALIRKIWEAKINHMNEVILWGDGTSLREFTYARDAAGILLTLLHDARAKDGPVNIGNTQEYSIKEVAENIAYNLDFRGKIYWNVKMPSGQHRKPSSNEKLRSLGFNPTYSDFNSALQGTCSWFVENYPNVRGVY